MSPLLHVLTSHYRLTKNGFRVAIPTGPSLCIFDEVKGKRILIVL